MSRQMSLDGSTSDPRDEWVGMPEFVQEKQTPHQTIIVRFRCAEDVSAFAKRIGQRITPLTKSLWFPPVVRGEHSGKVYSDAP